jgi:hypothetical protein
VTPMPGKWRRRRGPYVCESGGGHVTIIAGKEYGAHSDSAWNRK